MEKTFVKVLSISFIIALSMLTITQTTRAYTNTPFRDFILDAPHRVDPGETIPFLVLVKDANEYPFALEGVDLVDDRTDISIASYEYDEYINGDLWYRIHNLDSSLFSILDNTILARARFRIVMDFDVETGPISVSIGAVDLPKMDGWYAGDAHVHSYITDSIVEFGSPVDAIASSARAMGLDWIILTDHSFDIDPFPGEWDAYKTYCAAETIPNEFVCMLGEEITCQDEYGVLDIDLDDVEPSSHYLAYGISSPVYAPDWWGRDNNPTQQSVIDDVRDNKDGIGFIAHPFDPIWDWENWAVHGYTGIEIWNGEFDDESIPTLGSNDLKALQKWYELLSQGKMVYAIGNSDAHDLVNIGRYVRNYVYLGDDELTESNVIDALGNGRFIMTDGPLLSFTVEDHPIGDEFTTSDDTVNLAVSWKSTLEYGAVSIINVRVNGEPVENNYYVPSDAEKFEGTKPNWSFELPPSGVFCFTVYCETTEGRMAFTNPIRVNKGVLDVYMLVDLSGSFADDLPIFKVQAPNIVSNLEASHPGTRFGLGKFEDYPIHPFGDAASGDKAYERIVDLTSDTDAVLSCISSLFTRYGEDTPQSQLPALFQAATGAGQDLSEVGFPEASIPPEQQANFRDGATKLFILWTDAPFHNPGDPGTIPYPGPSFDETVEAIQALDPPMVIGISSGSGGVEDLRRMATATGALAPTGGVDTNGDGTIDILEGEPLVCAISPSGFGIAEAIEGLVGAAAVLPVADANGPYEGEVGEAIVLDASGSFDSDGYIVLYEWDFDGDGIFDFSSTESSTSHVYETVFTGVVLLRVTDEDGNTDTDEASITIVHADSTPPETWLTIGEPKYSDAVEKVYVSSATPFTLTAEDNPSGSGVAGSVYRVWSCDHAVYDTGWIPVTLPTSFNITGVEDGRYRVAFYSSDKLGNEETINVVTVVVDNSSPLTTLSIDGPEYVDSDHTVTFVTPSAMFSMAAFDAASGLCNTSYRIANSTYDSGWMNCSGCFCLDGLMNGNYALTYCSSDYLGNTEEHRICELTLVRAYDCPGDVNGDRACDIYDFVLMANCYRLRCDDEGWNPIFDFTNDAVINIFDLASCAAHYTG